MNEVSNRRERAAEAVVNNNFGVCWRAGFVVAYYAGHKAL